MAALFVRRSIVHSKLSRPNFLPHRTFSLTLAVCNRPSLLRSIHHSSTMDSEEHPATHQQSKSTEGKHDWKTKPPYSIFEKNENNENFDVKLEAHCHCERVKYQLSREEPLDSKLCHCTTCQVQHGMWPIPFDLHTTHHILIAGHNLDLWRCHLHQSISCFCYPPLVLSMQWIC